MSGLLDFENSGARMGLGLLAAASPRFDGAGFGQRLQEAVGSVDQWKQQKTLQQMRDMQMQEMQAKIQQEKSMRDLLQQFIIPASKGLGAVGSVDKMLPDQFKTGISAPAVPGHKAGFDYQGYAGALAGIDPIKALALQQSLRKETPKFSTAPQYDQQGNAFILAENGEMKYLNGVKARDKLNEVRLGDKVGFRTDYSTEIQGSLPIGQSPDSKATNALGWANYGLTKNRDALAAAEGGKPQLVDGQWVYKPTAQNPMGRVVNVAGINEKPLNESQGAATNFGNRAMQAHEILSSLEATGGGQPGAIKRAFVAATPGLGMNLDDSMGSLTNWTQSKGQQSAEQAQRNFITAVLRKESGASISPGEFSTASQIYFPQPGDDAATKAQKARTRDAAIEGLKMQAGPGAKHIKSTNTVGASGSWGGVKFLGFE